MMMASNKKRKVSNETRMKQLPKLLRADVHKTAKSRKEHLNYYKYEEGKVKRLAEDYFFGNENESLYRFVPALVEIQKSRMNPEHFKRLEGNYYRWKYEKVLKEVNLSKCSSGSGSFDKSAKEDNIDAGVLNNGNEEDKKGESKEDSICKAQEKDWKNGLFFRAENFSHILSDLKDFRISFELKVGYDFLPWIYLKSVKENGEERIGMFAGRDFGEGVVVGFYIGHPLLKWLEAFTVEIPPEYDGELQKMHLLPETEAEHYMWFYDDEGFMTACDPVNAKSDEEGKFQNVACGGSIFVGMGFHLAASLSVHGNIDVDNNGCLKTDKSVPIDTELVWNSVAESE